jgi:hypothetical protein
MVFDLTWIVSLLDIGQVNNAVNVFQITRAARASKLGARTARFIRVIRLIRMMRVYKTASVKMTADTENRRASKIFNGINVSRRLSYNPIHPPMIRNSLREDRVIEPVIMDKPEELDQHLADKAELERAEAKRNKFKLPPIMMNKKPMKPEL